MTKDDWSAIAPDMIRHERKHVKQWEKHGVNFIPRYLWEGADACGNKFEEQAGYADGNYQACIP
ncbi:hypothetical protein ACFWJY_05435 [Streptomyces anulatus]